MVHYVYYHLPVAFCLEICLDMSDVSLLGMLRDGTSVDMCSPISRSVWSHWNIKAASSESQPTVSPVSPST